MDCLDCHNRPSHNYNAPQNFTDKIMSEGVIPKSLPEIKLIAMMVLNQVYSIKDSAFMAKRNQVIDYYTSGYPELLTEKKEAKMYAPKKETIDNILNYSKALSIRKSKHLEFIELNLN